MNLDDVMKKFDRESNTRVWEGIPKLIITCGVSGAIQFTACMNGSDHIVSINTDKDAPIFDTAHIAIVGDLYEIVPQMIQKLKEAQA